MVFYKCLKSVPDNLRCQILIYQSKKRKLTKNEMNYFMILAIFVPAVVLAFTTYTPEASEATSKRFELTLPCNISLPAALKI